MTRTTLLSMLLGGRRAPSLNHQKPKAPQSGRDDCIPRPKYVVKMMRMVRYQKAAPRPFFDCRLLNLFRFTFVSSRLAWLLVSWFRPDLSLTLNPSGKVARPPRVLDGLDMDDDISPNPFSLPYEAPLNDMDRSFAR